VFFKTKLFNQVGMAMAWKVGCAESFNTDSPFIAIANPNVSRDEMENSP
jgi:hypothetical protein